MQDEIALRWQETQIFSTCHHVCHHIFPPHYFLYFIFINFPKTVTNHTVQFLFNNLNIFLPNFIFNCNKAICRLTVPINYNKLVWNLILKSKSVFSSVKNSKLYIFDQFIKRLQYQYRYPIVSFSSWAKRLRLIRGRYKIMLIYSFFL